MTKTGEFIEHRRKHNSYRDFNPYVSGSWALEKASDNAFRVNGRWSPGKFYLTQRNHVTPAVGPERDDDLLQDFKNPVYELGGDITQPLAGGAIKLVGLATRRQRDWLERYRFRTEGGARCSEGSSNCRTRNATRPFAAQLDSANLAGLSVEAGVEGALNTLDHKVELFEFWPAANRCRSTFRSIEAKVKEKRAEAYVRVGRQLPSAIRSSRHQL